MEPRRGRVLAEVSVEFSGFDMVIDWGCDVVDMVLSERMASFEWDEM